MDHSRAHRARPADVQRLSGPAAKQLGTHAGQELGGDLPHTAQGENTSTEDTHRHRYTSERAHTHVHTVHTHMSTQCTHTERRTTRSGAPHGAEHHTERSTTRSGAPHGAEHHTERSTTRSGAPHGAEHHMERRTTRSGAPHGAAHHTGRSTTRSGAPHGAEHHMEWHELHFYCSQWTCFFSSILNNIESRDKHW